MQNVNNLPQVLFAKLELFPQLNDALENLRIVSGEVPLGNRTILTHSGWHMESNVEKVNLDAR